MFDRIKRRRLEKKLMSRYPDLSGEAIKFLANLMQEIKIRKKHSHYRIPHAG